MIAAANFVGLPLMFLSAILIPPRQMPNWIEQVSRFNPVELGRARRAQRDRHRRRLGRERRLPPVPARGLRGHVIVRDVVLPRVPALYLTIAAALALPATAGATYGWPLKPFDRQHAVRSFFDDPRAEGTGASSFHFGIDISARDGTPVYAVADGVARLQPDCGRRRRGHRRPHVLLLARRSDGRRSYAGDGRAGDRRRSRAGFGHVHFTEIHSGRYVNPLRPGGITPYVDSTSPTVVSLFAAVGTHKLSLDSLHGDLRPARGHVRHAATALARAAVESHARRARPRPLAARARRRGVGAVEDRGRLPLVPGLRRRRSPPSTHPGRRSTSQAGPPGSSTTSRTASARPGCRTAATGSRSRSSTRRATAPARASGSRSRTDASHRTLTRLPAAS